MIKMRPVNEPFMGRRPHQDDCDPKCWCWGVKNKPKVEEACDECKGEGTVEKHDPPCGGYGDAPEPRYKTIPCPRCKGEDAGNDDGDAAYDAWKDSRLEERADR